MDLHKRCVRCKAFFPAKPLEFKFFCDKEECKEYYNKYHFYTIKSNRHLPAHYFDLYDLDLPMIHNNKPTLFNYQRVCRICGEPLLKKDGTYSYHKRYCNEHNGDALWEKYNWGSVSKNYARKIRDSHKELIKIKFNEIIQKKFKIYKEVPNWIRKTINLTICELCSKLCQINSLTYLLSQFRIRTINIHHKIPIHTLKKDNLQLIWDEDNLIALCEDCHKLQNHQLKRKVDPYLNFKRITDFVIVRK